MVLSTSTSTSPMLLLPLLLSLLPTLAMGASNGMNMTMDGGDTLSAGMMVPYLHFTPGDTLWFLGWAPKKTGAMVGACIGLFVLGIVDRWVGALRRSAEVGWGIRAQQAYTSHLTSKSPRLTRTLQLLPRSAPPFIASQDIARGVVHALQSALMFMMMLAVMTFQAAFFFSIVIGLGVGEAMFGRYGHATGAAGGHRHE